jgi:FAD/FMN-containing dehydrogenase
MFADHLISVDAVLGDGRTSSFKMIDLVSAEQHAVHNGTLSSAFYAAALSIRAEQSDVIRANWPRTWRRAAGYNLNYLLPWSPTTPSQWPAPRYPSIDPGHINLAALMAGSEGTLGIIRKAKIRLVPKQKHTVLAVLFFENVALACDATPGILEHRPSAVELIPRALIDLAGDVPGYANLLYFLPKDDRSDLLVVEYSGDNSGVRKNKHGCGPCEKLVLDCCNRSQAIFVRTRLLKILVFQSNI